MHIRSSYIRELIRACTPYIRELPNEYTSYTRSRADVFRHFQTHTKYLHEKKRHHVHAGKEQSYNSRMAEIDIDVDIGGELISGDAHTSVNARGRGRWR